MYKDGFATEWCMEHAVSIKDVEIDLEEQDRTCICCLTFAGFFFASAAVACIALVVVYWNRYWR